MSAIEHGIRKGYKSGCRCDQCKCAEATYQRELKQRKQESPGPADNQVLPAVRLASVSNNPVTSGNTALNMYSTSPEPAETSAVAAVMAEIRDLSDPRPGLVAIALEMARVLDDPKAITSKAPAAGRLTDVLDRLSKGVDKRRSRLSTVRSMTSTK
jgi:hypothetical protein